eukprot:TRINITY_DN280_c0_g1_i1.p1 TRINITY_DN280_c0_g1~~TRINITY_DN280_c0_g1_i1.p1  ORF type:complete len:264 (+),score=49.56 TRINITY_DN280_c0_g1_i1:32-793(+)
MRGVVVALALCSQCLGFVLSPALRAVHPAQASALRKHEHSLFSSIETEVSAGSAAAVAAVPTDKDSVKHAVSIRLYDIGNGMQPLISALLRKPMPHIWHVGVAVYGCEYWFSTKIEMMDLRNVEYAFGMVPIHVFDIGETTRTREEFEAYLDDVLAADYHAEKYDVFFHNCNHFANDVSKFLVDKPVPQHVLDMSEEALSSFGKVQTEMTKMVGNKLARYVMVAWGRANRQKEADKPRTKSTASTSATADAKA